MAMIKCKECGKEMSDRANMCPHCGCQFEIINSYYQNENYGMAIAALISSFIIPIVGLILGIIALNETQGENNSSRTMAIAAIIISAISAVIVFFWLLFISGVE